MAKWTRNTKITHQKTQNNMEKYFWATIPAEEKEELIKLIGNREVDRNKGPKTIVDWVLWGHAICLRSILDDTQEALVKKNTSKSRIAGIIELAQELDDYLALIN